MSDPRDRMQAEATAAANEFFARDAKNSSSDPHVGLPNEEEIRRIACDHVWVDDDGFGAARAILDLIRPAFEAREREANALLQGRVARKLLDRALSAEAKLAQAVEALEPFAKAAGVIAWTEKATGRVFDDAAPFRSGVAWRESEECRHLTYGHFRRARSASAAARGETR